MDIRPQVAEAVASGAPVVALESTVIAHGLPEPQNLEAALELDRLVREGGAVPATIGIARGRLVVGLNEDEIAELAGADDVRKVSVRDLASALSAGELGATTVASTMWAAAKAGIRVMATGGIGGVHRGVESSLDISADLTELGRTRVAVVCSGAKAILDLPRTLEALETLGVPVVGYRTTEFPAFYSAESRLEVPCRVDSAEEAAALLATHWELDLQSSVVIANPPPAEKSLDAATVERWIEEAQTEAGRERLSGAETTPFLLARIAQLSGGRSVDVNRMLLSANARLAAEIAAAWSAVTPAI